MNIADQLEIHANRNSTLPIISRQIDYLGKMPVAHSKPVKTSETQKEMLRFDLVNGNETIRAIIVCGFGNASNWANMRWPNKSADLVAEQDHQIDLATPLGVAPRNLTTRERLPTKKK